MWLIFSFFKDLLIWIANKLISLFKRSAPVNVSTASDFLAEEREPSEILTPPMGEKFRFLPDFSALKEFFARMTSQQKLYALGAIILIFIVPFFIVKIQKNMAAKK